jgi:hypothetical protein
MTKDGEFRLLTPQELNGTPTRMLSPLGPQGARRFGGTGGTGASAAGTAGGADNRLGSGTALTGQGLGSAAGTSPAGGGFGTSDSSATGPGGETIQVGPIAAVASKSTDQSIRIFKGRDHYNQWIVTIDDVVPRQFLRPQQPTQPGQRPGVNPGRQASPTGAQPSFGPTTPSSPIR